MNILVLNSGSSSIKYKLYDITTETERASGIIERVGEAEAAIKHRVGDETFERFTPVSDYAAGGKLIMELLATLGDPPPISGPESIDGVGHRVVHGGEAFSGSVRVDDAVLAAIESCIPLAPLHNPANLGGIRGAMQALPGKPQVAVFDTAFFQTMPPRAYRYAVPEAWYTEHKVRRYGFHGTSHRYVTAIAAQRLNKPEPNLITLHLGNGCSMALIENGHAIDQTMGLTPLEGLVMGTRSGDIDPAIIFHMASLGMSLDEIRTALEKKSGLIGLTGSVRDMRDVHAAAAGGDQRAKLALEVFAHRAKKYVGAFLAEIGHCDAVVYTGGIGENDAWMRARILDTLAPLGIALDSDLNAQRSPEPRDIATSDSRTRVLVIPTDEELMIARDTAELIG
jgi:acetate kinase